MKILLMGDASNYHATLARGLRALGHDVTVASNGSRWMGTGRDIDLSRGSGKIGGALLWLRLHTALASQLRGFDIVQICSPGFIDLRPCRQRQIFDRLRRHNGALFMTMLGTDSLYARACQSSALRYNEWYCAGSPTPHAQLHAQSLSQWLSSELTNYCQHVYENVNGIIAALYEYYRYCQDYVPADKLGYAGIPIDMAALKPTPLPAEGPLRIMAACHRGREAEKGFDQMLPIIQEFAQGHPDEVHLDVVQNVPFSEFERLLDMAHIVVDQLYSYTPATTALMAMARGKVVVSGGEPEYYEFIGESQFNPKPIINADPQNLPQLGAHLEHLLHNRRLLTEMGATGPDFVRRNNEATLVAQRFIKFWTSHL